MKRNHFLGSGLIGLAVLSLLSSSALAHYLWVAVDSKSGEHGTANVFFEEGPAPGDGHYLDPFVQRGVTWIRTPSAEEPQKLDVKEFKAGDKRYLTAALPAAGPRSIDSYGKWGVYRYGQTDVLLHYYARILDTGSGASLKKLARAEQMDLDIVPSREGDQVNLRVLWKGEPAPQRPIYVRGPQGFKATLQTDENGAATFQPKSDGSYRLRTYTEENTPGNFEDKDYAKIRHNATLILPVKL